MTCDRIITTALAAVLALPAVAAAPGYFEVPGTGTAVRFYGFAELDMAWDGKQSATYNNPIAGLSKASSKTSDDAVPKNQFGWSANYSRLGITTTTSTSKGDVIFKIEGDFRGTDGDKKNKNFQIRHAYGQFAGLLAGQTNDLFFDKVGDGVEAVPIDIEGLVGTYGAATTRVPQIRYTMDLSKQMSLAFALEQATKTDTYNLSTTGGKYSYPLPSIVSAFMYKDSWGHVRAAVGVQKYDLWIPETPTTGDNDLTKTTFSWNATGTVYFGQDHLAALVGKGDGNFGPALNAQDTVWLNATKDDLIREQGKSWGLSYTHVWTPDVNTSLFIAGANYSRDTSVGLTGAYFKSYQQIGANMLYTMTKSALFGVEYIYGQAKTFDSDMIINPDKSTTDKITENRVHFMFRYMFN